MRVAGGIRSKARAAAGTKSNFVLITHPRCLRQVFSNKEFDLRCVTLMLIFVCSVVLKPCS